MTYLNPFRAVFIAAIATATVSIGCTSTSLSTPDPGGAKCQVTVSGPQTSISGVGGSGTVVVNAAPECAWSVSTEAPWITDVSPATGQGGASVQFKAAPNPEPVSRQGDIAVSGILAHVNQDPAPCAFEVKPQALTIGFGGGSDSVTVTTIAGCAWSALSQVDWIVVTSPKENSGAGTVTFDVSSYTDASARSGSITVAGQTITVQQSGRNCTYSLNPSSANYTNAGGAGSVSVTAPAGCTWTATSNAPWITVGSGANGSGPGSVAYSVGANAAGPRTGALSIAGQAFTINQTPAACSFGMTPTSQNVSRASGSGATVSVATQSFCSWTAVSNDAWITVTPPGSGMGNGNVSWTYSANQLPVPRTGTMTIADKAFTVTQDAGCSYGISPTNQNVTRTAGTGTTVAITTQATCSWTAVSNASWITVNSGASGAGNGNVGWAYAENTVATKRSGTMTIAGQTFTVTQDPGCSYSISPTSQSVRDGAGTGSTVTVTTQTSCGWTAGSNASWITLNSPGSGNGNGSVGWTYAANTGVARTGTMTIAGQTFTVDQSAPCTYTVAPVGQTISALGGAGTPIAVTTQTGCFWTAVSNDSWITVTSADTGTGSGTVQISVSRNVVFAGRAGTLIIGGHFATVIQSGVIPGIATDERLRR